MILCYLKPRWRIITEYQYPVKSDQKTSRLYLPASAIRADILPPVWYPFLVSDYYQKRKFVGDYFYWDFGYENQGLTERILFTPWFHGIGGGILLSCRKSQICTLLRYYWREGCHYITRFLQNWQWLIQRTEVPAALRKRLSPSGCTCICFLWISPIDPSRTHILYNTCGLTTYNPVSGVFYHIVYALNVLKSLLTAIAPLTIPFCLVNNCLWNELFMEMLLILTFLQVIRFYLG